MESISQSPVKKQSVLEGEAKGMERVNVWKVARTVGGVASVSHSRAGLPFSALLEASAVQVRAKVFE